MTHDPLDGLCADLPGRCAGAMARHACPSISVAVARRGELVLAAAHGLADIATGRPATPDTPYAIASITKPMTATAVCLAADRGLLDLDHVLRALVPGYTAALIDPSVPSTLGEGIRLPGGRVVALDLGAELAVTYGEGDSTGWLGNLLSFPLFLAS